MQIGPILAVLAAMIFGMGQVIVKRAVARTGESFTSVSVGIFTGALLFAFVLFFIGDWGKVWSLSWQGWVMLAAAGVSHFAIGRLLGYHSIGVIGANKASVLGRASILYAVTFAVIFLHEPITFYIITGILCIGVGVTLVGLEKEEKGPKLKGRGVVTGLAAALFWGISPVLIRPTMSEIGSPVAATFISYLAASLVIAALLSGKVRREQLTQLNRSSLPILVAHGMLFATAQLLRYTALSFSPVSIVNPLGCTIVVFVFIFSFLINRNLEVFTWKVLVGVMATVTGAFLLFK